jgi:hypothetical protein
MLATLATLTGLRGVRDTDPDPEIRERAGALLAGDSRHVCCVRTCRLDMGAAHVDSDAGQDSHTICRACSYVLYPDLQED